MKKNIDNENIVLDEEMQNVKKQKSTAKRIVLAVILILLAVVFVVLGFCLTFGTFDNINKCNVAFAGSTESVDSLQSQASSDWSLSNINSYDKFYGVFFNRTWKPTYAECVANKSLFFYEGGENEFCVRINSSRTDIIDGYWTRFFTFYPFVLSVDYAQELGIVINSDVYAIQSEISLDMSEETIIGGILLIAENDDDMSAILNSDVASTVHFTDSFSYSMFDFTNVGTTQIGSTYGDWVLSDSTNINDSFVDFFGDFLYLSLSNMGGNGVSEDDYNAVVSENENLRFQNSNLQAMIDKYDDMFSYVPIEYKVVNGSLATHIGGRVRYDISKFSNIFITNDSVLYSSLIDVNTGAFIGDIEGLKDGFTANGIWGRLYTETDTYYNFAVYCQIAHLTPKTTSTPKGKLWSWDSANNTLTCLSDVIAFSNETIEEEFNGYYDKGFNDGKFTAENDVKTTTDGIISVLESPINFLKTVFNFEIFGINLSAVIFFVLSVVIVAYVIKKVV